MATSPSSTVYCSYIRAGPILHDSHRTPLVELKRLVSDGQSGFALCVWAYIATLDLHTGV